MEIAARMGEYEQWLRERGFCAGTVSSYLYAAAYFERTYGEVSARTLGEYRDWLVATFKPATANQRVPAINCYLGFLGREDLRIRSVRVQQVTFLERAMGEGDYRRLLGHLREGGYERDYHAVRLMATTGARVSELLRMEVRHMRDAYMDVSSKGKVRRISVPSSVAADVLAWAEGQGRRDGRLFLNQYGRPISARGLATQLKVRAAECGVDESLVHPHAFRHMFARSFLAAGGTSRSSPTCWATRP